MIFSEHTYSILIVSASEKFSSTVTKLLPVNQYYPVVIVKNSEDARRLFFEKEFNIVLINSPLPDELGNKLAVDICEKSEAGVLLLSGSDNFEDLFYKTVEFGVLTIAKPVTERILLQNLSLLCATFERMKRLMKKQDTVDEKIEEMRLVNQAKWILIDHAHMTEPEAHRFIEKKAMDDRITRKAVAERIISQYK